MLYFPFGETWVNEVTNDRNLPYRFTGKELDEETQLYYFGARYYDPRVSLWTTTDPALTDYLPLYDKEDKRSRGRGRSILDPNGEAAVERTMPSLDTDWGTNLEMAGMGGVYEPRNLSLYAYSHQNPMRFVDPDGESPIRAGAALFKLVYRSYRLYRKTGKLDARTLKRAGLDEFVDIADDLNTIFSGNTSGADKLRAAFDLATGFNTNKGKAGAGLARRIQGADRTGSGLKSDAGHRAASFLTRRQIASGRRFTIRGGDGVERTLVQSRGSMNGNQGIFEYILDPSGKITHQRFIRGGMITGRPNQRVP